MYVDLVAIVERNSTAVGNQFYCSLFATMHICGGYHHVPARVEHSLEGLDHGKDVISQWHFNGGA